jgi:ribonucleoside-diphosphate reductase alpha chain
VPKSWTPLATKIAVSKYFYGDIAHGTDPYKGGRERSVKQLIHRVTRTLTDCGLADGYFADKESAEVFYNELTWLCVNQYGAFNSPVWFNVGLWHQYRVGEGRGEGTWFYDRTAGEARRPRTQYEYPQGSACFIQSVDDTMEDIMRLAMSEAMLFKYGSGTGTDLSSLRSTREKLSGGGKPSGPLSFLKVYDQVANVVKSGGKTRRAGEDEHAQGLASGHRGVHRGKDIGGAQGLGAHRAGLRWQLQRRRLRLDHVSKRKPLGARER